MRDSRAEQIDYGSDPSGAQVRVLRFDHAGHLWPVANPLDREQEIAAFGFRNQDIDMGDVIWEFFRSRL
jgi:poly(3-hydroxybutyrate) depolymerase